MKIEDIEKAAGDYSGSILGFKDSQSVMDKHKSFSEGAEWRINSVWHDASELPNGKKRYIALLKINDKIRPILWTGAYRKGDSRVVQWAYIEDLLPTKD